MEFESGKLWWTWKRSRALGTTGSTGHMSQARPKGKRIVLSADQRDMVVKVLHDIQVDYLSLDDVSVSEVLEPSSAVATLMARIDAVTKLLGIDSVQEVLEPAENT